ncbi:MAG TPA: SRPBCC family protein [Solirubrobacteraceae bacterium]|jgi:carbon monoxide dehydrogenase subunit G|nr:SRPBCC family protein [Solirubrobacteraceae bacterium]
MEIVNEFTVGAEPDTVFRTLLDFERVGRCVPGASVGPPSEDGSYPAQIAVRLGPMRLNYRGTVRLSESDAAARHAIMTADVREVRGQGSARAQMEMDVSGADGGSQVVAKTNVVLSGRAAQMGAGIVEDVAARLVADMTGNLERLLQSDVDGGADGPPPASGGSAGRDQGGRLTTEAPAGSRSTTGGPATRAPAPAAKPIGGLRLLIRALWHRLRHGRGRPPISKAVPED